MNIVYESNILIDQKIIKATFRDKEKFYHILKSKLGELIFRAFMYLKKTIDISKNMDYEIHIKIIERGGE